MHYLRKKKETEWAWIKQTSWALEQVPVFLLTIYLARSSAGKESICNAGDPGLIPGLGWSPGEGIGYPLHCSWASLVARMVRNPPAMQETWVWSLVWEDPPEDGMATHSSIPAWRIPMDRGAWQATVHGVAESGMTEWRSTAQKTTWVFSFLSIKLATRIFDLPTSGNCWIKQRMPKPFTKL